MSAEGGGKTTMSRPNGELQPTSDPPALSSTGKRKRASLEASTHGATSSSPAHGKVRLHETLRNLVEILSK